MSRIRLAVAAFSRSGLLNANETAVFDTPARSATSAIVTRRVTCSTPTPLPAGTSPSDRRVLLSRVAGCVSWGDKTGLANRFRDRNRHLLATSMIFRGAHRADHRPSRARSGPALETAWPPASPSP